MAGPSTNNNMFNISDLTAISWNARGVKSYKNYTKMHELQNHLNNSQDEVHIICIQETYYDTNSKPFNLKGYQQPITKNRKNRPGGGVCIYIKEGITFIEKTLPDNPEMEVCAATIFGKNETIDIFNVYVPAHNFNKKENYEQIFNNQITNKTIMNNNIIRLIVGFFI